MVESKKAEEIDLSIHWIEAIELPGGVFTSFPAENVSRISKGQYGGTRVVPYKGDPFEIETHYQYFKRILQTMRQIQIFMPPVTDGKENEEEESG